MKKFKLYFLLFGIIAFTSCSNNDNNQFQNLKEFYASNLKPEVYNFNNNEDIKIIGEQGTRLTIPKTAISNIDGNIKVSFKEFFKKSDLILNNIPTNSRDDSWLETGGSFFLHIQDASGKNIVLNEKIELEFPINSNIADTSNMSVWRGDGEAVYGDLRPFNSWKEITSGNVKINRISQKYVMSTLTFNWINCDHIFDTNLDLTKVKVLVTNPELNVEDINTFIVLKNINSVLRLYQNNKNFESFPIPIGEEAYVVSIAINKEIYLHIEPITISKNQAIQIQLDQVSLDELYEKIKVLDN